MSAWPCCGEYNEHSPNCITIKYSSALEEIYRLKGIEHEFKILQRGATEKLRELIAAGRVMRLAISQCGNPNAEEACRLVIQTLKGFLGDKNDN